MSAGYAFASVVARAFANYAWPADVRGVETDRDRRRPGGWRAAGAVPHRSRPSSGTVPPSRSSGTTTRNARCSTSGLMPLSAIPFSDELVFGAVRSLLVPQRFTGATAAAADANARLSSQINSILCASRFAHHLKMKGRQMVGSFKTADEIERQLQEWLTRYVNANVSSTGDSRARLPAGWRTRAGAGTGRQARQLRLRGPIAAALPVRRRVGDVPARDRSRQAVGGRRGGQREVPGQREVQSKCEVLEPGLTCLA